MAFGTCALCLAPRELRDSHILPKWSYKRIKNTATEEGNGNPLLLKDCTIVETSQQIKKRLLCTECEQRFCLRESYVSMLAYQENDTCPVQAAPVLEAESDRRFVSARAYDWQHLAYFGVSVLWRAAVSRATDALHIHDDDLEMLRVYLLEDRDLPSNMRLILSLFDADQDRHHWTRSAVLPASRAHGGHRRHHFWICGLYFQLCIGDRIAFDGLDGVCFVTNPDHPILIAPPTFWSIVRRLGERVAEAEPRGKLQDREALERKIRGPSRDE